MIVNEKKLEQFFKKLPIHSVYYFYSTELYLVNKAAKMLLTALSEEDSEPPTVLAGPAPSVEEIVLAAGTISFFGNNTTLSVKYLISSYIFFACISLYVIIQIGFLSNSFIPPIICNIPTSVKPNICIGLFLFSIRLFRSMNFCVFPIDILRRLCYY